MKINYMYFALGFAVGVIFTAAFTPPVTEAQPCIYHGMPKHEKVLINVTPQSVMYVCGGKS